MPNIDPQRIAAVLAAEQHFGLNTKVFHTPLTWYRSGTTQRSALHVNEYACPVSDRPIMRTNGEERTFAELAGERVCECVLTRNTPIPIWARFVEHAQRICELADQLGPTPDWDTWRDIDSEHHLYQTEMDRLETLSITRRSRSQLGPVEQRRGYHVKIPNGARQRVATRVERALTKLEQHVAAWTCDLDASATWWEHRLGGNVGEREHAVINIWNYGAAAMNAAQQLPRMCHLQYGIASSREHDACHLVYAPAAVLNCIESETDGHVTRIGSELEAAHVDLFMELYEPGCNTGALLDTVRVAVPT